MRELYKRKSSRIPETLRKSSPGHLEYEKIFFANPPETGSYVVKVNQYAKRTEQSQTKFQLLLEIAEAQHYFEGAVGPTGETKDIVEVKVMPADGNPIIKTLSGAKEQ